MDHTISLTAADLDLIESGSTVTVVSGRTTFEITSDEAYIGPAGDTRLCRFGIGPGRRDDLRGGRVRTVRPVAFDGVVTLVASGAEVAR